MANKHLKKATGFQGGNAANDHAECLKVLNELVGLFEQERAPRWDELQQIVKKARKLVRDD